MHDDPTSVPSSAPSPERGWFADDRFWQTLYPYIFCAERLTRTMEEVDAVLALAPPRGERVLDLCCGPGRHAVELARRGFNVTGVDRSPFLLGKARERARDYGVTVEWVEADMREYERPERFDLALNLFSSLGYFESDHENNRPLQKLYTNLVPGGMALIDLVSKEWLAKALTDTSSSDFEDGSVLFQRRWIQPDWQRIRNQWILVQDQHAQSFLFEHQLYSGVELRDRLLSAGFRDVRLYGNFLGEPMSPATQRLIAVAQK